MLQLGEINPELTADEQEAIDWAVYKTPKGDELHDHAALTSLLVNFDMVEVDTKAEGSYRSRHPPAP